MFYHYNPKKDRKEPRIKYERRVDVISKINHLIQENLELIAKCSMDFVSIIGILNYFAAADAECLSYFA